MSEFEAGACIFCGKEAVEHGIHGAEEVGMCPTCIRAFAYVRYLADPLRESVLGFTCSECGFTCDVPGDIYYDVEQRSFIPRVDSKHKFCQNCGASTRTVV